MYLQIYIYIDSVSSATVPSTACISSPGNTRTVYTGAIYSGVFSDLTYRVQKFWGSGFRFSTIPFLLSEMFLRGSLRAPFRIVAP